MRLAVLFGAFFYLVAPMAAAAQTRYVLVLYSYSRVAPAMVDVDRGIREGVVDTADRDVQFFSEFLDEPIFAGPAHQDNLARYLREKYAAHPPEILVAVGEPALEFLLRFRDALFAGRPVVHSSIAKTYLRSKPPLPADVIGTPVEFDALGTIQLALRLHPNTRRLVIVTGTSDLDRIRESRLRPELAQLALPLTVEFLAGLPTDALVKRLRELGDGDVVYTPGYLKDGAGRVFFLTESARIIADASSAPVYAPYAHLIGTGIVGGRMPSFVEMGREGARAVQMLLDGTPPGALRLPETSPLQVQVDWRQVRKWSIGKEEIPADAIVHFREPTLWEAYRTQALLAIVALLLQAGLIAALLIERRRRQRTAAALEESEKRMSLAAYAARLSMWMWDLTHDKIWVTSKLRQHAGLSKSTPVNFDQILQTVHPADRDGFNRAVRQAAERGTELEVEYRAVQPDGAVRWFSARGHAAESDSQRLTGVKMDITARKVAELQAEKDRSALTHMTRVSMMGQLSAAIAHQLNQPLAAILGNAEAARKMLQRADFNLAELREICDDIVTEDNRAADVIRRLSALYKRGEMTLAPLDLNELVRETLDLVRTELMNRHVEAATDLAPSLPAVDGGRVQLQQVLLNLILNAADAMSDVVATERKLVVRTEFDGANVRLCVVDRGTGIAPADMKNVFDAFWSTKAGGIGVGLAICHSILTAHQGTLTVTNNPGGGATFCAKWPMRQGT